MVVRLKVYRFLWLQKNYLETIYSVKNKPISTYPKIFIKYLVKRFEIKENQKLLELGCGRGEFLNEFVNNGIEGYGVDLLDYCKEFFPNLKF
jgi:cyclopropane fatty-acyl-phospholipid synthase-like methyltransferase